MAAPPQSPSLSAPGYTTRTVAHPSAAVAADAPRKSWAHPASVPPASAPPRPPPMHVSNTVYPHDDSAPLSRLAAAALRGVGDDVEAGVARAARTEGLAEMLTRFKQSVAVDDADEEHGSALRGLVGGAGGDDDDDGTAEATGMAEGEPPRTPRGPAFQID